MGGRGEDNLRFGEFSSPFMTRGPVQVGQDICGCRGRTVSMEGSRVKSREPLNGSIGRVRIWKRGVAGEPGPSLDCGSAPVNTSRNRRQVSTTAGGSGMQSRYQGLGR